MTTNRSKQIWDRLRDKNSRDAYVVSRTGTEISFQIRANRQLRKMTQLDLGRAAGMKQTAISRLEGPNHGIPTVKTLLRIASAFDCALLVEFVPFSELVERDAQEREFAVNSFGDDSCPIDGLAGTIAYFSVDATPVISGSTSNTIGEVKTWKSDLPPNVRSVMSVEAPPRSRSSTSTRFN